jgi:ABC-type nitrate/sulfonate/bicarbonate transport system ATPase subunit
MTAHPNDTSTMPSPKLCLKNVNKTFDLGRNRTIEALNNVSFDVAENEMCVLLGPSGCGKSTVLRMIGGLEKPTSGSLMLDGQSIRGPDRDRGMIFQGYTSFDWLSVQKNVEYGMRLNSVPKDERRDRASHFINLVGLHKFRDAYPNQLSGGMKQRVAIARTLANEPKVILMDEPFGALDAETRWQMQELMLSILEQSRSTVVMVTHDIEEGLLLGDRIIFMSRHPGTVGENIEASFKKGIRISSKEELLALDGYVETERHIMQLMRQQTSVTDS